MTRVAELLRSLEGREWTYEEGDVRRVELGPPLSEAEIDALEEEWGMPVPADARDVLRVTREIGSLPILDYVNFSVSALDRQVLAELFPYTLPIAADAYGNQWSVDVLPGSKVFGPVFYICHDPSTVVYQCADVATFIEGLLELVTPPHEGPVHFVYEEAVYRVGFGNEIGMELEAALESDDKVLRAFAESLPHEVAWIADMRRARIGEGFETHSPEEFIRHPSESLFARLYV